MKTFNYLKYREINDLKLTSSSLLSSNTIATTLLSSPSLSSLYSNYTNNNNKSVFDLSIIPYLKFPFNVLLKAMLSSSLPQDIDIDSENNNNNNRNSNANLTEITN